MKKIKQKRQLIIEIIDYTDNSSDIGMKGNEFTLYEIIGIFEQTKQIMIGKIKPTIKKLNEKKHETSIS